MIEVSTGGYLMAGSTDPGGSGRDAWLVRIDADGNQLWNHSYRQSGSRWENLYGVVECSDGGFAAVGRLSNNDLNTEYDVFVLKVDSAGVQEWNSTFGGSNSEYAREIIEVSGGGFAVISFTDQFGAGLTDMWLIRLDTNGNHLWNNTYGGSASDQGYSLTETSSGFALLGITESFGAGGTDIWLVHVDTSGNHLWNQTYGGTNNDYGLKIRELANGDFGFCGDTLSFGPDTGVTENAWFFRVDATGTPIWNHTYGGTDIDYALDFNELSDGFVLCGSTRSFDVGAYDYYVIRTDNDGTLLWNHTYGGADVDNCLTIVAPSSGGFIAYGDSLNYGAGLEDYWVISISDGPTTTPPPPLIPGFPFEAIAVAVILGLGIGMMIRRRKR